MAYQPPPPLIKPPPAGRYRLCITSIEKAESKGNKHPMLRVELEIIEPTEVTFEGEQVEAAGHSFGWFPTFIERYDDRPNKRIGNLFEGLFRIGVDRTKCAGNTFSEYVASVQAQAEKLRGYAFWAKLVEEPFFKKLPQTEEQKMANLKPVDEVDEHGNKIKMGYTLRLHEDNIEAGGVKYRDIPF